MGGDGFGKGKGKGKGKGGWDDWGMGGMWDMWGPAAMMGFAPWSAKGAMFGGKGGWGPYGGKGGPWDMWGDGGWGEKEEKKAVPSGWEKVATGPPVIHWLASSAESTLVQAGLASDGPAILFDKKQQLFHSSWHILNDVINDCDDHCQIEEDEEGKQLPELYAAFKQASGEDTGFAIATCLKHGKWGAGFSLNKKGRESAARLALAVAIVQGTEKDVELREKYPVYTAMLDGGVSQELKARKFETAVSDDSLPTVIGLTLPETTPILKKGLFPNGSVMVYDKAMKEIFSNGPHVLGGLLGFLTPEVIDDPEWTAFPEIGAQLKKAGIEEDCFAVAVVPGLGMWAVGVSTGWKGRDQAARLALSLTYASRGSPKLQKVMEDNPQFVQLMRAVGINTEN